MEQRTCNIIMCCKGHCELPGGKDETSLPAVAAYMAHECACPREDYKGRLMETVMKTAMFDFMETADKPGFELRNLFDQAYARDEPTLSERIATMFGLTRVNRDGKPCNGFTEELLAQSEIDLGARPGRATGQPDDRPVGECQCGGCVNDARVPDPDCGRCLRNPDAAPGAPDMYRPVPGLFCKGCAHAPRTGPKDGLECMGCSRCPSSRGDGLHDLYRKADPR